MNDFLGWHWITKEEDCSAREEKYYFAKRSVGFEETTGMNYTWQKKYNKIANLKLFLITNLKHFSLIYTVKKQIRVI